MLKFLKWIFGIFSPYVNTFEWKVARFFRSVKSTDNISSIRGKLLKLMQGNLIVVNIWLEKKYKGYLYLTKKKRRKMYENVLKIRNKFELERSGMDVSAANLKMMLDEKALVFPNGNEEKLVYLFQIMSFLSPGKYYNYINTASFGKLLRDPDIEKLEGDCNQIVTFYAYLYSLKFPLDDLQIKLLPEHVCLHFKGIDIEATNGTFCKYSESDQILPITEIISTNLLDLHDFREEVISIDPRTFVKSAQLAYAVSSLKELVSKNLHTAYHNLGAYSLNAGDYQSAIFYFDKAGERDLVKQAYQSAASKYLKSNNFKKAAFFASKSGDNDLKKAVKHNEGVYYFKRNNFDRALDIFRDLGDGEMQKACYGGQYNQLAKQVSGVKTVEDAKKKRGVYQKMLVLAGKMQDGSLERNIRQTLSQI